jgi:drug/metabolite transporter (DMT)-like permease
MNEALSTYFAGEKNGGLVLVGMGVVMAIAAVLFFPARHDLRTFAITVGVWSALELAVGIGLFLKTDGQLSGLQQLLSADRAALLASETPRMELVQRNFALIQYVWMAFIVAGALLGWWLKDTRPNTAGVALAFLINASMFLSFEISAERRGAVYLAALKARSQ